MGNIAITSNPEGPSLEEDLGKIFEKHESVTGISVAVIDGDEITPYAFGIANRETNKPVTGDTLFQIASCSKTIATYLILKSKAFPLDACVNTLLEELESPYRIQSPPGSDINADDVTVRHLLNHTALNMHYVNGIPEDEKMPDMIDLLSGNDKYDYAKVELLKDPGSKFKYSGGGFILAQHLMDLKFGKSWRARSFDANIYYDFADVDENLYAMGYRDDTGDAVRLMFPAFAAGMIAAPRELAKFLVMLRAEFKKGNLLDMLDVEEKGARDFIGGLSGTGIFLFRAGENQFIGHHGANDGFRGIYLLCIDGPNDGEGMVIFSNGEEKAIFLNAEVCRHIFQKHFGINEGMTFPEDMGFDACDPDTPKEQLVNMGMKSLVFDAFEDPYYDWSHARALPSKRAASS